MNASRRFVAMPALLCVAYVLSGTGSACWGAPPVLSPDLTEDSWMKALSEAIKADGWREPEQTSPTVYKELEAVVPKDLRAQMRLSTTSEEKRFVPTEMMIGSPIGHQPKGILSGKIIYSNAGHGWTFDEDKGVWFTQRPLLFDMVEDLGNGDQLSLFADFCWRAGATFVPMRPVGHQSLERIMDNEGKRVGWQGPWFDAKAGRESLHFGPGDAKVPYRYAPATLDDASVVRYNPVFGVEGLYPVYVWVRDGIDRVPQTYRVVHRGGCTEVNVDHRRVGKGWVWIGTFPFAKGANSYVEITSKVDDASLADGKHVVVADAVRFGNGLGDLNRGSGISGYPREEEASLYWAERMLPENGFATHLTAGRNEVGSTVGSSPRTCAYMNNEADGAFLDRALISFHSNALNRTKDSFGRGATGLYNQTPEMRPDFQVEYGEECARVINDLLSSTTALGKVLPAPYDPFTTLTFSQIDFGEIRRDYTGNEMPATIVEVAFHDDEPDTRLLRSPFVRHLFARSMVQAIANLFANHDALKGSKYTLPPGAPDLLAAVTSPDGKARLIFRPAEMDEAMQTSNNTAYKLYSSADGLGFDGGTTLAPGRLQAYPGVSGTYEIATGDSVKTAPRYYKIAALNAGGESRPSWTLGTYEGKTTATRLRIASVLPVPSRLETFDDLNLTQTVAMNLHGPLEPGGAISRFAPELMQTGVEVLAPAQTLQSLKIGFDTIALREKELFNISPYNGTIVGTGRRTKVADLSGIAEPVFVSGSAAHPYADKTESLVLSDAVTTEPVPPVRLSEARYGYTLYGDSRSDILQAGPRTKVLMNYVDETLTPALVAAEGEVVAGFPFEAIDSASDRVSVMKQVLTELKLMKPGTDDANTSAPVSAAKRTNASRVQAKAKAQRNAKATGKRSR